MLAKASTNSGWGYRNAARFPYCKTMQTAVRGRRSVRSGIRFVWMRDALDC
jgi:hypothetical protein